MSDSVIGTPLLEVTELRAYFATERGVARAVDGVSLRIGEGECVGVVGESGCGKTAMCLALLGLLSDPPAKVQPGSSVRIHGKEIVGASQSAARRVRGDVVSMVFQEPMTSLNPVYTVGDQIIEGLRLHRGMDRAAARTEAARLLTEVGIAASQRCLDQYPHQLSGGMRQRVLLAIALSGAPDLLIADEPTTALDVTIQAQILDLLKDLRERRGMALLLVTHDLAVVAEVCDRVMVMYGGQIVESGSVEEVLTDPRHPYTKGLLASLPDVANPEGRLATIEGVVPHSSAWPSGCRFNPRCPDSFGRCSELPPLFVNRGRAARCWLAEADAYRDREGERSGDAKRGAGAPGDRAPGDRAPGDRAPGDQETS